MSFEAIYRRYHQDLYRYCLAILANPEDAQDALQNTMVKAMRALQGEKRQIKLKPWLYRIAHNESIDLLRRRRPTEEVDVELAATGPGAAEAAETRQRLRELIADLEGLPDRQRGALVMRELAGFSFQQIGAAFDTSPAVARQTVYEARLGLREMEVGREMTCAHVMRAISDADGRIVRRRDIRAHLRACRSCREFRDGIGERRRELAALAPLPALAATGLLQGILGGASGTTGAGLAGSVGAGAGKVVATSAIAKSAATVAVVAAVGVGVGAADRGGLIDVPLPSGNDGQPQLGAKPMPATEPTVPTATLRRSAAGVSGAAFLRHRRQGADGGDEAGSPAGRGDPSSTGATGSHGRRKSLPIASGHSQETAAAHRSVRGQSKQKSQSRGKGKAPPPSHAGSKAHGPRTHPPQSVSPPHNKVGPDKPAAIQLQPSNSANQGEPEAAAQPNQEAR
jgi:RNA polymerase sigma factor (sigma-70 family)